MKVVIVAAIVVAVVVVGAFVVALFRLGAAAEREIEKWKIQ